jgi:hypothetical protein
MEVLRMTRRKQKVQETAADEVRRKRQERDAEQVEDLPNRDAMSILSGFPSMPGLPIIGGDSGTPIPNDPSAPPAASDPSALPPDASGSPGDLNSISPTNNVTASNVGSAGTTEATGAVQDAPIVQR